MTLSILPFDLLVEIVHYLSPEDILSLSSTCRDFHEALNTRGVWLDSIQNIFLNVPLAHIERRLDSWSTEELRRSCVAASLLESRWHLQPDVISPRTHEPPFDRRAHSVQMLPGGQWLVIIARDALLHLRRVNSLTSKTIVPLNILNPRTILRVTTQVFLSRKHETILLTCATLPLRTSNLNLFRIDTDCSHVELIAAIDTGMSDICAYAFGGDLVAYETRPGTGGLGVDPGLIHIRNISERGGTEQKEAIFSVGDPLDTACDAIAILSNQRMLVARARSIALYDIPYLGSARTEETTHLEPVWRSTFDTGGLGVSPMLWEPRLTSNQFPLEIRAAKHVRHTTFLGVNAIHIVTSANGKVDDIRHHIFPLSEAITASSGAVGFRRAVWTKHERSSDGFIKVATCTLPDTSSADLPGAVPLIGSISIPATRGEWVIDLSFDEGTGRICAFIGDRWNGPRRVVLIDVI